MPTWIVTHSEFLCNFLTSLLVGFSPAQLRHALNYVEALLVCTARHKTLAALTRWLASLYSSSASCDSRAALIHQDKSRRSRPPRMQIASVPFRVKHSPACRPAGAASDVAASLVSPASGSFPPTCASDNMS
jgi:hypothetical protein